MDTEPRHRTVNLPEVQLDADRLQRCGYPEVVYAPGKSMEAIVSVFNKQRELQQDSLATRVDEEFQSQLVKEFPAAIANPIARTVRLQNAPVQNATDQNAHHQNITGKVCVVTAGTGDRPVAEEALETLRWMNCDCDLVTDVGVAGPHRLPEKLDQLHDADALVVVAGMEGALPSVVAGWVACPVIGVPTSVGYGANLGGISALLSMLNSCAANVSVVNIDAGFKGGYLAGMIAQRCHAKTQS